MNRTKIGIDAAGTLIKIAYNENGHLHLKKFLTQDLAEMVRLLRVKPDVPDICLTGGKAGAFKREMGWSPKLIGFTDFKKVRGECSGSRKFSK